MAAGKRETAMQLIEQKIKTFSRVEQAFYASVVVSGVLLAVAIIFMQTKLLQVNAKMADINQEISTKQVEIDDAKQAVNELIRHARLMEISEKQGLTFNNEQIGVAE